MPDEPSHQPHDKLFKTGFSDPANAAAFLAGQLPAPLSQAIDWTSLVLQSGSFIDTHFRHSESDLLFSAPLLGQNCLLYLLFEHQRRCDRWIALRLLNYMLRIWESFRKDHPKATTLPIIVPIILAQNVKKWALSPQFSALFLHSQIARADASTFIPDFTFRLIQLAELPFEKIMGTPSGILVLRTLKAKVEGKLLGTELWDEPLMDQALTTFEMILRYIYVQGEVDKEAFARRLDLIRSPAIKEVTMTLAQQLRQEGRQEGLQGLQRAIISALKIRFDASDLPELQEKIARVQDLARLQSLLEAALRSVSLHEFENQL